MRGFIKLVNYMDTTYPLPVGYDSPIFSFIKKSSIVGITLNHRCVHVYIPGTSYTVTIESAQETGLINIPID